MIVVPKTAQRFWLTVALDYWGGGFPGAGPLLIWHLYRNDFAPDLDTVLADFTESTFAGYGVKFLGNLFPAPFTNADGFAQSNGPVLTWSATNQESNEECHGWYATFQTSVVPALLVCCERIVPAVRMNLPAATVRVQPKLTLGSRFAS